MTLPLAAGTTGRSCTPPPAALPYAALQPDAGSRLSYSCRWPVKRKRALLGSNPPRN